MEKHDNEMKARIYKAAKQLFYDIGYKKTTYKMIGETVNGNSALIAYYFGTKGRLAVLVYNEYMNGVKQLVKDCFEANKLEYDVLKATALEIRVHGNLMRENRDLSRFYAEIMNENILVKEDAVNNVYFKEMAECCNLEIPEYKLNFLNFGEFGFRQGVCSAHEVGKIDCSYKEFTEASIEILLLLLRQVDRIDEIIKFSKEFEENLPKIAVKKDFELVIL
ncbi:TetR family transcriptional regulator [Eubacteriaceae bacterium ES3]|nr:TetR family transcriptional regulator [Eubacteriaceae bacterium ES3]